MVSFSARDLPGLAKVANEKIFHFSVMSLSISTRFASCHILNLRRTPARSQTGVIQFHIASISTRESHLEVARVTAGPSVMF